MLNSSHGSLRRLPWLIGLLLALGAIAVVVWTAPLRERSSFRRMSLPELLKAERTDSKNPQLLRELGIKALAARQYQLAAAAFSTAAPALPNDETTWIGWASALQAEADTGAGYDVLKRFITANPHDVAGHFAIAVLVHQNGDRKQAYNEAAVVTRLDPHNGIAWQIMGLDADKAGHRADAAAAWRHAIAITPKDWRNYVGLGNALSISDPSGAVAAFRTAVELAPHQATALTALGQALLKAAVTPDQVNTAQDTLRRAFAMDPTAATPARLLAGSFEEQGRAQDQRKWLETAEKNDPGDPEIHYDLAKLYQRLGDARNQRREVALHQQIIDYQSRRKALEARVVVSPNNMQYRMELARLCASHGEYAEADLMYRSVLIRWPGTPAAQEELSTLERQHSNAFRPFAGSFQ